MLFSLKIRTIKVDAIDVQNFHFKKFSHIFLTLTLFWPLNLPHIWTNYLIPKNETYIIQTIQNYFLMKKQSVDKAIFRRTIFFLELYIIFNSWSNIFYTLNRYKIKQFYKQFIYRKLRQITARDSTAFFDIQTKFSFFFSIKIQSEQTIWFC